MQENVNVYFMKSRFDFLRTKIIGSNFEKFSYIDKALIRSRFLCMFLLVLSKTQCK